MGDLEQGDAKKLFPKDGVRRVGSVAMKPTWFKAHKGRN